MVGFATGDPCAGPVPGYCHRVDGVDRAAGGAQACDQQPAGRRDRHRDRVLRSVAVPGQQVQQLGQAGRVVADPAAGQRAARPGPPARCRGGLRPSRSRSKHPSFPPRVVGLLVHGHCGLSRAGHARSLMEGLARHRAIRSAVRDPSCPQAPVLPRARRPLGAGKGLLLRVARPTTTHTAANRGFRAGSPACRGRSGSPSRAGARSHTRDQVPVHHQGSPAPAARARSCRSQARHPVPGLGGRHGPGQAGPRSSLRAPSPSVK